MYNEQDVKTIYKCLRCEECGGNVEIPDGNMLLSYPPQRRYKCSTCKQGYTLKESDFPHMDYYTLKGDKI